MSQDGPRDPAIDQLVCTDLSRESAIRLVVDVLCRHFDALAEVLAREEEVYCWWSYHDFCRVLVVL